MLCSRIFVIFEIDILKFKERWTISRKKIAQSIKVTEISIVARNNTRCVISYLKKSNKYNNNHIDRNRRRRKTSNKTMKQTLKSIDTSTHIHTHPHKQTEEQIIETLKKYVHTMDTVTIIYYDECKQNDYLTKRIPFILRAFYLWAYIVSIIIWFFFFFFCCCFVLFSHRIRFGSDTFYFCAFGAFVFVRDWILLVCFLVLHVFSFLFFPSVYVESKHYSLMDDDDDEYFNR